VATTDRESAERVRRASQLVGVLVLAMLLVLQLPLPFRLAGLAFGGAAIYLAMSGLVTLSRKRRRDGERARGHLALAVGIGLAAVMTLRLLSEAAVYPLIAEYERCQDRANTRVAQEACVDQFEARSKRLEQRAEELRDRLRRMIDAP
jgi:hypothetical protein